MMKTTMPACESDDAKLVWASRAGDRDAFGQIVARCQSLICSLAYSATGRLCQSEDLAQETFLIARRQLAQLREPEKLRSWLCSIARSVISKRRRIIALLSPPPTQKPPKTRKRPDFPGRLKRIYGNKVLRGDVVVEERNSRPY